MPQSKPDPAPSPSPAAEPEPAPSPPPLPRASESGDPVVHRLLAIRDAHRMVAEDDGATTHNREHAQQAMADVDRELAEMGFR